MPTKARLRLRFWLSMTGCVRIDCLAFGAFEGCKRWVKKADSGVKNGQKGCFFKENDAFVAKTGAFG